MSKWDHVLPYDSQATEWLAGEGLPHPPVTPGNRLPTQPGFPTKRVEGAASCTSERSLGAVRALAAAGSGVEPGVEGGERLGGRSAARAVRNEGRRDACGGSGGSGP